MEKTSAAPASKPAATNRPAPGGRFGDVDREALREAGYILPGAPVTGLAEEFRIIKRQLLLRSEEHTSELQSLMRIAYADLCLKTTINKSQQNNTHQLMY